MLTFLAIAALLCSAPALNGQTLLPGNGPQGRVRLHTTDLAVFEAGEERDDLPCAVSPNQPVLGFDLRFHAGYDIAIPLRDLAGGPGSLSVLFRVTPASGEGEPVHFVQHIRVPEIREGARGNAYLSGSFELGEGSYGVDWLMRDHSGRVCSHFWDMEAKLSGKDRSIDLNIGPSMVRPSTEEQFEDEPPLIRASQEDRLSVKVLVNFAPQSQHSATLQPADTSALVSILRTISREPRIGKFSVVAFNLHEQRVLHSQRDTGRIDFPALGRSLETLELGAIDLGRLSDKHGETKFLAKLIREELGQGPAPDALIFAGPKAILKRKVPEEELEELGRLSYPIYYMNYNLYPYETPWRDTIGAAVKSLDGREYTITQPGDLWRAVREMVSEIAVDRDSRRLVAAPSE